MLDNVACYRERGREGKPLNKAVNCKLIADTDPNNVQVTSWREAGVSRDSKRGRSKAVHVSLYVPLLRTGFKRSICLQYTNKN